MDNDLRIFTPKELNATMEKALVDAFRSAKLESENWALYFGKPEPIKGIMNLFANRRIERDYEAIKRLAEKCAMTKAGNRLLATSARLELSRRNNSN
jgi:hypothetical protein